MLLYKTNNTFRQLSVTSVQETLAHGDIQTKDENRKGGNNDEMMQKMQEWKGKPNNKLGHK